MPFITFEGVEGSGKSTQLARAAEKLRALGEDVFDTREPGGTEIGRKIREILMDVSHTHLDPAAEWLLLEADRRQHVVQAIRPALARGVYVLCDRYSDSTAAYQAAGRGLDAAGVEFVDAIARDGVVPDLTLLYDVLPGEGLARARSRDGGTGRFEAADAAFHERVRLAYLEIARRSPERVRIVPAAGAPDEVFRATWSALTKDFSL
ncbi:MAG: dTMP kinase [Acidobacteriota bacterium]